MFLPGDWLHSGVQPIPSFSGFSPLFQVQMYRTLITRDRLRNDQRSAD
jgi:hypothetical protein